jgi:hypothetical protein
LSVSRSPFNSSNVPKSANIRSARVDRLRSGASGANRRGAIGAAGGIFDRFR